MHDYSVVLKPVLIAIGIAVVAGIALRMLEGFLISLFPKKKRRRKR